MCYAQFEPFLVAQFMQNLHRGSQQIFDLAKGNQDERAIQDESFTDTEIKEFKYSRLGEDYKKMEEVINDITPQLESLEIFEYRK